MVIADIAHGEVDTADILFLVAVILGAIATVLYALATNPHPRRTALVVWAPVFGWLGFTFAALAWLVL